MTFSKDYKENQDKNFLQKSVDHIKSYFSASSLIIFGSGATLGFAIGATSKLVVDLADFFYSSGSYAFSNFPNYDILNSLEYTSRSLSSSLSNAFSEGIRAAPMYGLGTLFFARFMKRAISSIFRKGRR